MESASLLSTMTTITDLLRSPSRVEKVTKTIFYQVDTERSGLVSERDLETMLRECAEQSAANPPTTVEIKQFLDSIERTHEGKLTLPEFKAIAIKALGGAAYRGALIF